MNNPFSTKEKSPPVKGDLGGLARILAFAFLVFSWPFIYFPLTDGDIAHWVDWARGIAHHWHFLAVLSDQSHGPLLAWATAPFVRFFPTSFYAYNVFNLICGMLGVWWTYYFAQRFWGPKDVQGKTNLPLVSSFIFATSLVVVYFSRTPMYDWPAAIFYFGFCGYYYLHCREGRKKDWVIAMLCVGVAALSRFSISIGLAGIYMLLLSALFRRSLTQVFRDGLSIIAISFLLIAPWLYVQTAVFGDAFLNTFIYDNLGRFISDSSHDAAKHDFYGFTLYALVGIFPFTFPLLATLFQKGIINRIRTDLSLNMLLAGFLPCLIIFSLSGHTKLGRYISYVFPYLLLFLSYNYVRYDWNNAKFKKRCTYFFAGTAAFFAILLGILSMQFQKESADSPLFVIGIAFLIFALIFVAYWIFTRRPETFVENPTRYLVPFGLVYGVFFTLLSYLSLNAPFLLEVRRVIMSAI